MTTGEEELPLYEQVCSDLRQRIVSGEFKPDDRLPSENDLSRGYGVSKITTRRALQELDLEGFVERKHGYGTVVRPPTKQFTFEGDVGSLLENFASQSLDQTYEILEFRRQVLPDDVCETLKIADGSRGLRMVSIAMRDGERVYYTTTCIPAAVSRGLTKSALRKSAAILVLMQRGALIGAADQRLQATTTPNFVQRAVNVAKDHPVLHARLTIFDPTGAGLEHVDSYLRGDLFEYRSVMTRGRRKRTSHQE